MCIRDRSSGECCQRKRGVTMTIEEILAGESKNVEFKENLPEKSIKYMKSVVAFANGIGGKIIFGIADKTREVVGFDKEDVFKKMDAIANAVSDSCEPDVYKRQLYKNLKDKSLCKECADEVVKQCYFCKELFDKNDGETFYRDAGTKYVCPKCVEKHTFKCSKCKCLELYDYLVECKRTIARTFFYENSSAIIILYKI